MLARESDCAWIDVKGENVGLIFFLSMVEISFGMAVVQIFIPRSALGPGFGKTISSIIFFCLLGPVLMARKLLPAHEIGFLFEIQASGLVALR